MADEQPEQPGGPLATGAGPVEVRHDPDRRRYEAWVGQVRAGRAEYVVEAGAIVFLHTQVVRRMRGRGVASALIRGALDDVREGGMKVVARCPKVRSWIAKHPDYQDLVRASDGVG